ncbi:MAG: hypothetical protein J5965_06715 [Aeriscardovia sp.]|nr:hypothetical protein [Aeriscardovia sp.]
MARNTRIKITAIKTHWQGKMRERFMNETLFLRTARKEGDEEVVNNFVLGQLRKHQQYGEISFEEIGKL